MELVELVAPGFTNTFVWELSLYFTPKQKWGPDGSRLLSWLVEVEVEMERWMATVTLCAAILM